MEGDWVTDEVLDAWTDEEAKEGEKYMVLPGLGRRVEAACFVLRFGIRVTHALRL